MISFVEMKFDTKFLADDSTREVSIFVFLSKNTNINGEHFENVFQIPFGRVTDNFVNILDRRQLNMTFHDCLNGFVLFWSVYRWVSL